MLPILVAVMGPTASGKTDLAERLADRFQAQLINADAFQVYRGMDLGTAKPTAIERYELVDIKTPNESYGVGEFVTRAQAILADLYRQERSAVVVGGTGLNIRALFEEYGTMQEAPDPAVRERLNLRHRQEGLSSLVSELQTRDPVVAEHTDLKNPVRVIRALERLENPARVAVSLPPFQKYKAALVPDLEVLNSRIQHRVLKMVQNGWVREVEALKQSGYDREDPGFRAIGYRQIWDHLEGRFELEEAIAAAIAETKRYAKRQRTWLRSEPNLKTLTGEDPYHEAVALIETALN